MVLMTIGLRTVMTICAVALVDAMPSNRTSIGAALNDTAQEVGTSVGTAVVGTLIAALVTTQLPAGTWSSDLVASFFHGERITYAVLAVVVGLDRRLAARSPSPTRAPPRSRSRPEPAAHSAQTAAGRALVLRRVAVVQRQRVAVGVQADRLPADAGVERLADETHALRLELLSRDGDVGDLQGDRHRVAREGAAEVLVRMMASVRLPAWYSAPGRVP